MTIVRSTLTMAYRKTTAGLRGIGRKFESKTDYMRRVDYCDTLHGAWHQDIETPEPIGCAFIPLDQDQGQQGQQQQTSSSSSGGQGGSQFSQQPTQPAAEIMVHYMNGHIDHPIGYVFDRRTYPYNQKAGTGQIYDPSGNGQSTVFTNDGIHLVSTKNPRYGKNEKEKDRYTSVRYVQKTPQQRDVSKASQAVEASQGGQQQQQQQTSQQDYKHEGETGTNKINTEYRVNKNQHQHFSPGDKVVGLHERPETQGSSASGGSSSSVSKARWKWDAKDTANGNAYTEISEDTHTHVNQNSKTTMQQNYSVSAGQQLTQQSGSSSSYSAGSSLFVGGSSTHLHGQIIAEPINLGHFNKTALSAAFHPNTTAEEHLSLLGDTVTDSGITMSAAAAAASPPGDPTLGYPYNGFRWNDTTSGIEYSYYNGIWSDDGGAIAFPTTPTIGQIFTFGARKWRWNGVGWEKANVVIANNQVTGARMPGWALPTGTVQRTTYASYTAASISNPPTQAQVQALANAVQDVSRVLAALIADLHATAGHGLIGT